MTDAITVTVKLNHPSILSPRLITVRKAKGINPDDYVGSLGSGTSVTGKVYFDPGPMYDVWMQIIQGQYVGYWIALRYNGKQFVTTLPENPVPMDAEYAFGLHRSQNPYRKFKNYMDSMGFTGAGDPSCHQCLGNTLPLVLNKQMQITLYNLDVLSAYDVVNKKSTMTEDQLHRVWANKTMYKKAYTDGGNNSPSRPNAFYDAILNLNSGKPGITAKYIYPTGHTFRLVGKPFNKYGFLLQGVRAANILSPKFAQMNWKDNWEVVFANVNSHRAELNELGKIIPSQTGHLEIIEPFPGMAGDRSSFWSLMGYDNVKVNGVYPDYVTVYVDANDLKYLSYVPSRPLYPYLNTPERNIGPYEEGFWDRRFN